MAFNGRMLTTFDNFSEGKKYKTAKQKQTKRDALAGNRTRASRVAGENSTTEPPMLR